MFVNRESELEALNGEYNSKGASFTVIYGRRRVGKTTLISQYIKDKPAIFFYATEASLNYQLKFLAELVIQFTGQAYLKDLSFNSFEQLFLFLAENIKDKKVVLAIDEYQHLVKLDKSFSSVLQKVWDNHLKTKNIHLLLCGSVISMMHTEVLNYSAPLYGRRTSSIFLKQMAFKYISKFMHSSSLEEQIKIFAAFGAVPKYLELINPKQSFIDNVKNQILHKNSYLYNEVRFLIKEEINDPVTYFTILETIAKGDRKLGNIAKKMHVPTSHLTRYLKKLIDLDIVKKEVPITEKQPEKSKLGRYRIRDNFINFWFYYVFMNQSYLEIGNTDYVIKQIDESFNEKFVSFAFEDYVLELILEEPVKHLGFTPLKIGRWWNNQEEIDLVAIGETDVAFIECKWRNQKIGHNVLNELKRKAELVDIDPHLKKTMVIFSKKGFKNNAETLDGRFHSIII